MNLLERLAHRFHGPSAVIDLIESRCGAEAASSVGDAIHKALAGGASWMAILKIIFPVVISLLTGGTIDIPALVLAILALITGA